MQIRAPTIKATTDLSPGDLFYHLGVDGSVLCIVGRWQGAASPDELKIIPLSYPQSPGSAGVPIFEAHFRGDAMLLENVTAEVLQETYTAYSGASIYTSNGALFLPLHNGRGFSAGLLNLETGEIVDHIPKLAGFTGWRIVESDDNDKVIWEAEASENEQR